MSATRPLSLNRRKRYLLEKWRAQSLKPRALPVELERRGNLSTVVVWFDSGHDERPPRPPRWTTAWAYQPLGGIRLDPDALLLHTSGMGGVTSFPPDPHLLRRDGSKLRAFDPPLPHTESFDSAPVYITDLVAAWWGLACLRESGYAGPVEMVTDGKNAVDILDGCATPRYTLADRNLGAELRVSLQKLSQGDTRWYYVPKAWTRFLDAMQRSHKMTLRFLQDDLDIRERTS